MPIPGALQRRKRILLTNDQPFRLAIKAKALGRKALQEIAAIISPDAILRWHQELVAHKQNYSERRRQMRHPAASQQL